MDVLIQTLYHFNVFFMYIILVYADIYMYLNILIYFDVDVIIFILSIHFGVQIIFMYDWHINLAYKYRRMIDVLMEMGEKL